MSTPLSKKAIVIVEDNKPVAQLIRDTLNSESCYRGVVVHDGREALDVIHSIQASVILLDVSLPGLNGIELYDQLKAEAQTRQLPIIFVTASFEDPGLAERGITNIIPKPFNLDELLTRVSIACEGIEPAPNLEGLEGELVLDASKHDIHDITYFLMAAD